MISKQALQNTHLAPHRSAHLLPQKPRRNAQLWRAVFKLFQVLKVAVKPDVPKDRLLQPHVQLIEHAVDLHARKLPATRVRVRVSARGRGDGVCADLSRILPQNCEYCMRLA